jgi:hypothetical protein
MNRDHILLNLQEAEQELARTIAELRRNHDYDVGELIVAMQHLYHHLNTAWNGRDSTPEQSRDVTDELFRKWSDYPSDLPTLGSMMT